MGDLDLLGEALGADPFDNLWERASVFEIDGVPLRVASLDDLIAMKTAPNRPKDQTHVLDSAPSANFWQTVPQSNMAHCLV